MVTMGEGVSIEIVGLGGSVPVSVAVGLAEAVGVAVVALTTAGQKPPRKAKTPPLSVPASGWPIVPPT